MSTVSDELFTELEKHVTAKMRVIVDGLRGYVRALEDQVEKLTEQVKQVEQLKQRVGELERQLSKNSGNSNKPPSSDGLKKARVVSNREPSGRKPGGQSGHKGSNLKMSESPTSTVAVAHELCSCCGERIEEQSALRIERRQVVDIPAIVPFVVEYQGTIKECPHCGGESHAAFPAGVSHGVSYGIRIRATSLYLMNHQLVPYERTAEVCQEILGVPISVGALCELNESCFELLEEDSAAIKQEIAESAVVNFDETGVRCDGKLQWCHTACTEQATHYEIHEQRGRVAIDAIGILSSFSGVSVHDHFKAYFGYGCEHALCNSHHLRELKFVHEEEREPWAGEMRELLKSAHALDNSGEEQKAEVIRQYEEIIRQGKAFHESLPAFEQRRPGARGRLKQRPSKNLLDRLDQYRTEVLRFLSNPQVPFTNNQAERDLRMLKLKQKISGCYRTTKGAQIFCRIRGFLSTVRKRGRNVIDELTRVLEQQQPPPTPNTFRVQALV